MVIAKAKDALFVGVVDGKEVTFEIIFTFEDDATGKQYVVYTDNVLDEEGNTRVFASRFDPEAEKIALENIETDEEWELVSSAIAQYEEAENAGEDK